MSRGTGQVKGVTSGAFFWALFGFSEWLDGQGLIVGEDDSNDKRTHEELVRSYLGDQERSEGEAQLGLATTLELVEELAARTEVAKVTGDAWPDYRTVDES